MYGEQKNPREGPFICTFVLVESPSTSVSTVIRGHTSLVIREACSTSYYNHGKKLHAIKAALEYLKIIAEYCIASKILKNI
jgi:hypothetical protein